MPSPLLHRQLYAQLSQLLIISLIALSLAITMIEQRQRQSLDWHSQRGLSFLQLGLRQLNRLCYLRLPVPILGLLPRCKLSPAYASLKKREAMDTRIEFSRVTVFSF